MSKKTTIITSSGMTPLAAIRELLLYKHLIGAFAVRDLRVRYAQTYLGISWSIIQPLFGLASLFVLFYKIAGIQTGQIAFLPFALSGLIFWNYFNFVLSQSAASMVSMQAMVKKIYIPRLSIPLAKASVGLVDFTLAFILLVALLHYYGYSLIGLVWFPIILILTAMSALGMGLLVSSFSLKYRDLQQILPFLMQIVFFITPVAFPTEVLKSIIAADLHWIIYLNPLSGLLELWRHLLFHTDLSSIALISLISNPILLLIGIFTFVKVDKKMADIV